MSLNQFEYGQVLRANMGEDVSTNIGLTFILQPKAGTPDSANNSTDQPRNAIIRTTGVTVGTVDVFDGDTKLLANEYLEYTVQQGDFDIAGQWRIKGEAKISSTKKVSGNFKLITVLD